jgi:hypothetical protein
LDAIQGWNSYRASIAPIVSYALDCSSLARRMAVATTCWSSMFFGTIFNCEFR